MFGAVLASILRSRDRRPAWLANKISKEPSTVARWIAGTSLPEVATLALVREALRADYVSEADIGALDAAYLSGSREAGDARL